VVPRGVVWDELAFVSPNRICCVGYRSIDCMVVYALRGLRCLFILSCGLRADFALRICDRRGDVCRRRALRVLSASRCDSVLADVQGALDIRTDAYEPRRG